MNWTLDTGFTLDWSAGVEVTAIAEVSMDIQYTLRPFDDLEIEMEMDVSADFVSAVALDLLRLIPLKFHFSDILTTYIDEVELEVGIWYTAIRNLPKLANPNLVASRDYLLQLAALIGLALPPEDDSTEAEIRRSIAQAIDWYKVKGTYNSVNIIAAIEQFTINLLDMYTNDYVTFILTEWFVGGEDENPPGLDSTYYKSPHFGLEVVLDQVYSVGTGVGSGSGSSTGTLYLWQTSYLDNLFIAVEQTRPVHTVPHYILLLSPTTDEFGNVIQVDGNINTRVFSTWEVSTRYFDQTPVWDFDDSVNFDESIESFIKSITKWELGTGSNDINASGWSVGNAVLTGTIDVEDIVITSNQFTFSFIVPKSISQNGITELGLYTTGNELVLGSVFPAIDVDGRVELRVVVTVSRLDLST